MEEIVTAMQKQEIVDISSSSNNGEEEQGGQEGQDEIQCGGDDNVTILDHGSLFDMIASCDSEHITHCSTVLSFWMASNSATERELDAALLAIKTNCLVKKDEMYNSNIKEKFGTCIYMVCQKNKEKEDKKQPVTRRKRNK